MLGNHHREEALGFCARGEEVQNRIFKVRGVSIFDNPCTTLAVALRNPKAVVHFISPFRRAGMAGLVNIIACYGI